MRVTVVRGAGDHPAVETIIDPLCVTEFVGTQRGKQYLYDNGFDKMMYSVKVPYIGKIYPSDIVRLWNDLVGDTFEGRVTNSTVSIENVDGVPVPYNIFTIERCLI